MATLLSRMRGWTGDGIGWKVAAVLVAAGVLLCASAGIAGSAAHPANEPDPPLGFTPRLKDPHTTAGARAYYNLDYDRSVTEFEAVVAASPDDPFALNHLLNAELFRELYRMGVLNTGEYANDSFVGKPHHPPDPQVMERLKALIARTMEASEKRLRSNPNDVDALYCRGVTKGAKSTYLGLVERSWFAALRNAVGARHDHERVLELDPHYTDARLVIGVHEYVVGSLPWAVKVAASAVGEHGSRKEGIEALEATAMGGSEASEDARVVLVLFYRRENRLADALHIVHDHLMKHYPRNLLMAMEEGNLTWALGHPKDAEPIYLRIWESGKQGKYGKLHYELAAVGLGDLRRSQKDYAGAIEAYRWVDGVPNTDPELRQKAAMGLGEAYESSGQHDLARKQFERAAKEPGGSETAASEAHDRLKELSR